MQFFFQSSEVPIIEFSVFQTEHFSFKPESTILANLPTKTFFHKFYGFRQEAIFKTHSSLVSFK